MILMSTSNKRLADGLHDAASNLEALAQDYSTSPDHDQRRKVAGVMAAAELVRMEARRVEQGAPSEVAKARAILGTEMRTRIAALQRMLRRTLDHLSVAEETYTAAWSQWHVQGRSLEKLIHDIHQELRLEQKPEET